MGEVSRLMAWIRDGERTCSRFCLKRTLLAGLLLSPSVQRFVILVLLGLRWIPEHLA